MTHTRNTPASRKESLAPDIGNLPARAVRAWTERMAVTPLGGGRYAVETHHDARYVVDLPRGRCSCPDHALRGERCKHLRRVAIEVTRGLVPAPGSRAADCLACGRETFVREDTRLPLCEYCTYRPDERVRDRETGDYLVVVGTVDRRADEVRIETLDTTVAAHPTNRAYDPGEPVVEVTYPGSDRHYSFPRSRLVRRPLATGNETSAAAMG